MNNQHPWQLKKSKPWRPFWSYQLNSTANSVHLGHFWGKWAWLGLLSSLQLQNDSRILIFWISMFADYSFDEKNIIIWVPAYFRHKSSFIATVVKGISDSNAHMVYCEDPARGCENLNFCYPIPNFPKFSAFFSWSVFPIHQEGRDYSQHHFIYKKWARKLKYS